MMSQNVQTLILLQELDAILDDLGTAEVVATEQGLGFALGSLKQTVARRRKLSRLIDPKLLDHYTQLRTRQPRVVAPMRKGVCLGCNTRRPSRSSGRRSDFETCERCGRILFQVEESAVPGGNRAHAQPAVQAS
jgi:predicted  nucleic acid-binding Zn-ribbon protein